MNIFNIPLYNGTYSDFFQKIFAVTSPTTVFTPNPEILYRAYHDEEFMHILESATYNVPDGNGLYVAEMMQKGMGFFSACRRVFFDKKNVTITSLLYRFIIDRAPLRDSFGGGKAQDNLYFDTQEELFV